MFEHNKKTKSKSILAIIGIIVLSLGIVTGVFLVRQQQNVREKAETLSCLNPSTEQCPVVDNPSLLRNCHPPENDNSPIEEICDEERKIAFCGDRDYCCPSAGGLWSADISGCITDLNPDFNVETEAQVGCNQGMVDTFDGQVIDTSKWYVYGSTKVENGKLIVRRDELGTTSGVDKYDGVVSKISFEGDFMMDVDIDKVDKVGTGEAWAVVLLMPKTDPEVTGFSVVRGRKDNGDFFLETTLIVNSKREQKRIQLAKGKVKLRIKRIDGTIKVYYSLGSSYKLLLESKNKYTLAIQRIDLSAHNMMEPYTEVTYDNFKVTCVEDDDPTATPTTTATPTATGKKTATPTATGKKTATPTATGKKTATPTVKGQRTATPTNRSGATATNTSAPIPVTGVNWPVSLGAGVGILMLIASFILAL